MSLTAHVLVTSSQRKGSVSRSLDHAARGSTLALRSCELRWILSSKDLEDISRHGMTCRELSLMFGFFTKLVQLKWNLFAKMGVGAEKPPKRVVRSRGGTVI